MTALRWTVTSHAAARMVEMGVDYTELVRVLAEPETDVPSGKRYPGWRVWTRGELAVVLDPDKRTILTILWRGLEGRSERQRERAPRAAAVAQIERGESGP